MTIGLPPLPPSDPPHSTSDQRWLTQLQQLLNTALQGTNGYYTKSPTAGSTVTVPANVSSVLLRPAGVLATLTVQLPATVPDGTILRIVSSFGVTAINITAPSGVVILGPVTALVANIGCAYQFMAVNAANGVATATWQRLY